MATRGSRRMLLSLTRPLAELTRTCLPSKSTQTGVTCGLPSFISVLRLPKACFSNRSAYFSGINSLIFPSQWLNESSAQLNFGNAASAIQRCSSQLLHFLKRPAGSDLAQHKTLRCNVNHSKIGDHCIHAFEASQRISALFYDFRRTVLGDMLHAHD